MALPTIELRKGVLGFFPTFTASLGLVVCSTTLMMVCYGFANVGPAYLISMILAGVIVGLFALNVTELCLAMPKAGSMGDYARAALGHVGGMWQGIMYFMVFTGLAAEAMIVGQITNSIWPVLSWEWYTLILITIFFLFNLFGIQLVGWVQIVTTFGFTAIYGIGAIVQFAGGGIQPFNYANFGGFAPAGWAMVGTWGLTAIWLYAMVEAPIPLVEEIKNPVRNIPRGLFAALGVIFVLQALIGLAIAGTIGPEAVGATTYPQVEGGKAFFGTFGFVIFAIATSFATFSTFNAVMAATSRVLWGLGREGYLGKVIGYLHPRFRTPWVTLSIVWVLTIVLGIVIESPLWLASMDAMLFCITYGAVCVYTIILRHKRPDMERPFYAGGPFKIPIVSILGIMGILAVMVYTIWFDKSVLYVGGGIALGVFFLSWLLWQFYAKNKVVRE